MSPLGDKYVLLQTADGKSVAFRGDDPELGRYAQKQMTADGKATVLSFDRLDQRQQRGFRTRTADDLLTALTLAEEEALLCGEFDLGYGFKWRGYPSPLHLSGNRTGSFRLEVYGAEEATPGATDAVWAELTRQLAGKGFDRSDALSPDPRGPLYAPFSVLGTHYLEMWSIGRGSDVLPFLGQTLPHYHNGNINGKQPFLDIAEAPHSGPWFYTQPITSLLDMRIFNGPGPIHPQHGSYPDRTVWTGLEAQYEKPWEAIWSTFQFFCNIQASLQHDTVNELMGLYLTAYVAMVWGTTPGLSYTLPVEITETGIVCPDPGGLEGRVSPWGSPDWENGLDNAGCTCTCKAVDIRVCELLGQRWNGGCRTDCTNPPPSDDMPACDESNKRFLHPWGIDGQKVANQFVGWPAGAPYTEAEFQTRFGTSLSVPDYVAYRVEQIPTLELGVAPGGGPEGHGNPNWIVQAYCEVHGLNTTEPESITGTNPNIQVLPPDQCVPEIKKIKLLDWSGYRRKLQKEFLEFELRDWDVYWSVHQNQFTFDDLMSYRLGIANLGWGNSIQAACQLWNALDFMLDAMGNGLVDAFEFGPVPLRTDSFPPDGHDTVNDEWVFGEGGPLSRYAHLSPVNPLGGWHPQGPCDQIDPVVTTDYANMVTADLVFTAMSPTGVENNPGKYCVTDAWRLIGEGGYSRICPDYNDAPLDGSGGQTHLDKVCVWTSGGGQVGNAPGWRYHSNFPRLWCWNPPVCEVCLRLENGHLKFKGHVYTQMLLERTCWVPDPDGGGGFVIAPSVSSSGQAWMTFLPRLEIGFGADIYLNPAVVNPVLHGGTIVPAWLWHFPQTIASQRCGCDPNDPARIVLNGGGNAVELYF